MSSVLKLFMKMSSSIIPTKRNRPFTVIVEGNIGSGKTTFLNYFKKFSDVCVLAEPVEQWRNCNNINLLSKMYEDPKKWGFSFQSYVLLTMLQQHETRTKQPIKLMERSIYSARYCFTENMMKNNLLAPTSAAVLDEWFKWIVKNCNVSVDLVVYFRTTPVVVFDRVMKRNRIEEKNVTLKYLEELHEIHENWLLTKSVHHCPAPVLVIDANLDKVKSEEEFDRWRPQILNKIAANV